MAAVINVRMIPIIESDCASSPFHWTSDAIPPTGLLTKNPRFCAGLLSDSGEASGVRSIFRFRFAFSSQKSGTKSKIAKKMVVVLK